MPFEIDALLADASAAVYNRRKILSNEQNRLERIEADLSSQINSLNERINGLSEEHQKAWIAGNRNPELKKEHSNIAKNVKLRIKNLESEKSKNSSKLNRTLTQLQDLKIRISKFTKSIESIR